MKRSYLAVLLGSLCVVSTALAETYVRVEKDGTKTYSDRPMPGGQPVDLQPAQTYSAPSVSASSRANSANSQDEDPDFRYDSCSVTPANDSTLTNPESVSVTANTSPPLRDNDRLSMTVDGQQANGSDSRSHVMAPVDRGTHVVAVTVTSSGGAVLCSATSSFHVQRPGVNSPARQNSRPTAPPRPQPRG